MTVSGWGSWGQEGLRSGVSAFVAALVGSSCRGMKMVRSLCWSRWSGWQSGAAAGRHVPCVGGGLVSVESDVLQCPGKDWDSVFE